MNLDTIIQRAQRTAIIGELLQSFENNSDRADVVRRMLHSGLISPTTADMLMEIYASEVVS